MKLVGMPDSPYVRRVAVTLKLMDLPFEHQEFSVFRHFVASAWRFGQFYNEAEVPAGRYPGLVAFSARAEALPAFASTPLD